MTFNFCVLFKFWLQTSADRDEFNMSIRCDDHHVHHQYGFTKLHQKIFNCGEIQNTFPKFGS